MTDKGRRLSAARVGKLALPFLLPSGLVLFFLLGGHDFFSFSQLARHYSSLKSFVEGQLATALLTFGAAYILTVALSLPIASLLTLAGGALLGWLGAPVIICAATIGATIVFILAQTVLNEFFTKRTTGFMAKLQAGFEKNDFSYLLALRLAPAAPFWVVNIVPALLGMRLKNYILATLIGITPGTLTYVWVSRSFDNLLSRGQSPNLSVLSEPAITLPLFTLAFFSLIPALWKQLRARKQTFCRETNGDARNKINNG